MVHVPVLLPFEDVQLMLNAGPIRQPHSLIAATAQHTCFKRDFWHGREGSTRRVAIGYIRKDALYIYV